MCTDLNSLYCNLKIDMIILLYIMKDCGRKNDEQIAKQGTGSCL